MRNLLNFLLIAALTASCATTTPTAPTPAPAPVDPLPSWNEGANKAAIVAFVGRVTDRNNPGYVTPSARIAVFDNDGTLWSEQPMYFQVMWVLDRIRRMAPDHPEWRDTEPYASVLRGDIQGAMAAGQGPLVKMVLDAHGEMTGEAFQADVQNWLETARHPATGRRFDAMVYQPMLELLDYLRANGFKTFIVSGGGIDFMRVFAERVYGIPPEQVVGSSVDASFEMRDGVPTIVKQTDGLFVDDKEGKPVGIYRHIGRRPILAAGNSDGDLQMLQYTTMSRGPGDITPRLGIIVHHTDAVREFAYDRPSHIGQLDRAMDDAPQRGWLLIDMKNDWNTIYPDQE